MASQGEKVTVKTLRDKENNKVYPITSIDAVVDTSGGTLENSINRIIDKRISPLENYAVLYSGQTGFNEIQKQIARTNIGAASDERVGVIVTYINEKIPVLASSCIGMFECDSPADSTVKIVDVSSFSSIGGFKPISGARMRISFTKKNTARNLELMFGDDATTKKTFYWNGTSASSGNTWNKPIIADVWYDGSAYYGYQNIVGLDDVPIEDSDNAVKSGGVYKAINDLFVIDDDFSYVPSSATLTVKYPSLPPTGEVYLKRVDKLYQKIKTSDNTFAWIEIPMNVLA